MSPGSFCRSPYCSFRTPKANLQISLSDAEFDSGSTGTIDVFVRSDSGADVLDGFSFEFQVDGSGIAFSSQQLDRQLSDPNYLFAGNSQALQFPPASTVLDANTTMVTFDSTASRPPVRGHGADVRTIGSPTGLSIPGAARHI